jgi:hypothetical protein
MMDRLFVSGVFALKMPVWARGVILVSAVMQLVFGLTLLTDPTRILNVWPWPLPPLSARLLGASTLVSIPMALLSIVINRFGIAMIPLVMMITYRVLQLAAGLIHIDRFKPGSLTTVNYFGGGCLLLAVMGYVLWAGWSGRLDAATTRAPFAEPRTWRPAAAGRMALQVLAFAYAALGIAFLVLGKAAAPMWIDAGGLTPLTARLFASPLTGLGLGLWLCSQSPDWRAVFVPASGMVTIGFCGTLSLVLDRATFAPVSPIGWVVAATPLMLLVVGSLILMSRPARST